MIGASPSQGEAMKRYLVLYKSSTSAAEMMASATPEQMQAGMEDWNRWSQAAGDAVIDLGSPLGAAVSVGTESDSVADRGITGYSILQAETSDDLMKLLKDHPHLKTPSDSSITAIELLHMAGM
jgi:hypothetical protein